MADTGSAAALDLKIGAGASYSLRLQYPKDTPLDLSSGYTAHLQARVRADAAVALLDVHSTGGSPAIVLSAGRDAVPPADPGDPNIVLTLTPVLTLPLADLGPLVYDLLLTRTIDGYVQWLLAGTLHVSRVVTREA